MNCPNCGYQLRETDKNCFNCGALNMMNPENEKFKSYIIEKTNNKEASEQIINYDYNLELEEKLLEIKQKNKNNIFYFSNFCFYFFLLAITLFGVFVSNDFMKEFSSNSNMKFLEGTYFVVTSISIISFILMFCFYDFCNKLILRKANLPWNISLIAIILDFVFAIVLTGCVVAKIEPVVILILEIVFGGISGIFLLLIIYFTFKLVYGNVKKLLLFIIIYGGGVLALKFLSGNIFILVIGLFLIIYLIYFYIDFSFNFANRFNFNKWLFLFFPGIAFPIIALSDKYKYVTVY